MFFLVMVIGAFLLLILLFGVLGEQGFLGVYNQNLVCQERSFDSWSKVDDVVVCIRGEGESSEIRTASWVEEHCNNQGVCVGNDGEVISRPPEGERQ